MNALSPWLLAASVLAIAALLSCARLLLAHARRDRSRPAAPMRLGLLLLAQPALAALLYLGLFPPQHPLPASTLTVLTAGAKDTRHAGDGVRIALPEAPAMRDVEVAPDLATALRRHPGATRLRIVGEGLKPRDQHASSGRVQRFDGTPPATGIVALEMPMSVASGNGFQIRGRVAGSPGAGIELQDPAGQRVAHGLPADDGSFALDATVRGAGLATFRLTLRDAAGRVRDTLPLPLQVVDPPAPRLLVLAGAPDAELKYLRRWAADAGLRLHTRISVGGGLVQGDAPLALDARTLRGFDAVLLDSRSLQAMGDAELRALTASVREGLGVLLRIDGPLSASARTRLRSWGYVLESDGHSLPMQLGSPLAAPGATLPPLARHAWRASVADGVPLLADAKQQPFAWWRALGRGRIAITTLDDSYRLPLAGHGEVHARLWSRMFAAIARTAEGSIAPSLEDPAWAGQRVVLCGLAEAPSVLAPDGIAVPLVIDPATGTRRCAAFWPQRDGWHFLQQGQASTPFAVLPAEAGRAWQAQRRFDETRALVAQAAPQDPSNATGRMQRGAPWPWLAAWLLLAVLVWWLERRRPDAAALAP